MRVDRVHHVSIVVSNYSRSMHFYTRLLGFDVIDEVHDSVRESSTCRLSLHGQYAVELVAFPDPPPRPEFPEAAGLSHLALAVGDVTAARDELAAAGVPCGPLEPDPATGALSCYIRDPDGLPIELYAP